MLKTNISKRIQHYKNSFVLTRRGTRTNFKASAGGQIKIRADA